MRAMIVRAVPAVVLSLVMLPVGVPTAVSALPATGAAAVAAVSPDFDGDGVADVVVGLGTKPGRVRVAYGNGGSTAFSRHDLSPNSSDEPHADDFAQGILARDLNADGYTDLVVVDGGYLDLVVPAIFFVFGSASGLDTAQAHRYPTPATTGVGNAVALVEKPSPLLVVGARGTSVKGGGMLAYPLAASGLPKGDPTMISQASLGVPGTDTSGDAFGASLAASGSLLVVGVPGKDLGKVKDAGAISVLTSTGGTSFTGVTITQNSSGVPGKAEKSDRFGTAVAIGGGYVAVGVPNEANGARGTGLVQPFRVSGGTLTPMAYLDQNTKGIPGTSEADDHFGRSVALASVCAGVPGVVVGAPSETVGTVVQAGAFWLIPLTRACPALSLYEGGTLGGTPTEAGLLGGDVSVLHTGAAADTVLVAAPGDPDEAVPARVLTLAPPYTGPATTVIGGVWLGNEEKTITLSSPEG